MSTRRRRLPNKIFYVSQFVSYIVVKFNLVFTLVTVSLSVILVLIYAHVQIILK